MNETILVCDDDKEIAAAVDIYLTAEGYTVLQAHDGVEAVETIESHPEIQLILMDIMMPRLDGVRATMKVRESRNIPIIMLSAKSEDNDKILGLNIGADDYITKPFNPMELIARVKSQLRRFHNFGMSAVPVDGGEKMINGGLELDDGAKRVTVDGQEVSLTPVEYKIVKYLLENRGLVFPVLRSMRMFGTNPPTGRTTSWRCISAISVKRSKSIPRNPGISRSSGATDTRWKSFDGSEHADF